MRSFEVRSGHFDLDPERLTSAIPPQTKMIYIVNPHQPRGHRLREKHRFVKVHLGAETVDRGIRRAAAGDDDGGGARPHRERAAVFEN